MDYAPRKNTAPEEAGGGSAVTALTIDNRKEERFPADSFVCLILDHDGSEAVNGRLADVSQSGFRAIHASQKLTPGRVIRFHFEDRESKRRRSGWARVVWSRVLDSVVETGCFIVISD